MNLGSSEATIEAVGVFAHVVQSGSRGRFWCRINEGKWFGGVCLGIAAYGGFRVDWVRTVVLLLVLPAVATVHDHERQRDSPRYT